MKKLVISMAAACFCLAAGAAFAQGEGPKMKSGPGARAGKADPKVEAALAKDCKAESEKYCAGVEGPKLGKCLIENVDELSPQCSKTLRSLPQPEHKGGAAGTTGKSRAGSQTQAETALNAACKDDMAKFCRGAKAGPQQGKCLMNNEASLTPACAKALKDMPPPEQKGVTDRGSAAGKKAESELMAACRDDVNQFCRGVEPGRKQGNCLKENESRLTPGCGEALKTLPPPEKEAGAALEKACAADIGKFCKGMEPGMQQGSCLKENEAKLTAECGKVLKEMPPPSQEAGALLVKSCKADLARFCPSVEAGPQQGQCLMENQAGLSPDCAKVLKSLPPPGQGGSGEGGSREGVPGGGPGR